MPRFDHELIKQARLDLNMTQDDAAQSLGIDVRTYRRYESGAVNQPDFSIRNASRRQLLARIAEVFGIDEDALVLDTTPSVEVVTEQIRFAHPLLGTPHFAGRQSVLTRLSKWRHAATPESSILCLVGLGGAGKTAVARRFLELEGDRSQPAKIFVWSFYEDARTEVFVEQATEWFGGAANSTPDGLCALLRGPAPNVLVLDGLEVIQAEGGGGRARGELEDLGIRRILASIARESQGARALVTSRFRLSDPAVAAATIMLAPLSDQEADAVFERWGVDGVQEELRKQLEGHALSVAMAASFIANFFDGRAEGVEQLSPAELAQDQPLARRLSAMLDAYAKMLTPMERDLLSRIAAFPGGVGFERLSGLTAADPSIAGALSGQRPNNIKVALRRLSQLGLLSESAGRITTHPFVASHFRGLLGSVQVDIVRHSPPRLDNRPGGTMAPVAHGSLEQMLDQALEDGRMREAYLLYARALGGFSKLGLRAGDMFRGYRIVRKFAEDHDPRRLDSRLSSEDRAALAYDWALYAVALGDAPNALRALDAHDEVVRAIERHDLVAMGHRTAAYICRLQGNLSAALGRIGTSLDLCHQHGLFGHLVRALALRASIRHDMGDVDGARSDFAETTRRGDRPFARRSLWYAEHLLDLDEIEAADRVTRENLATCERLGWKGHAAHCHAVLGHTTLRTSGDARPHLQAAELWSRTTGEIEMILRTQALALRVKHRRGQTEESLQIGRDAHHLAKQVGFGLHATRLAAGLAEVLSSSDSSSAKSLLADARQQRERLWPDDAWGKRALDAIALG